MARLPGDSIRFSKDEQLLISELKKKKMTEIGENNCPVKACFQEPRPS